MFRRSTFAALSLIMTLSLLSGVVPPLSAQVCVTDVPAGNTVALIAAITCANSTTASETLTLGGGTYTLTAVHNPNNGLPVIPSTATAGSLTINGNGAIIERSAAGGTPNFRLFSVDVGGSLTLNNLTLRGGRVVATQGGAILSSGSLALNAVTITLSAADFGGAIATNAASSTLLRDSTLNANSADTAGGAIAQGGSLVMVNSTISGNQAKGSGFTGGGGGLALGGTTTRIINSTIAFNSAVAPNTARGGLVQAVGTLTIQNSIIADNDGTNNCLVVGGTLTDSGGNIDNGTTCGFGANSLSSTDPLLTVLAANGGPTLTHAPDLSSPAINFAITALAVDHLGNPLTTDQRGAGFQRIVGTQPDSGAYEVDESSLRITLTLEGRSTPPSSAHVVDTTVEFRTSPGNTLLFTRVQDSNSRGIIVLTDIPPRNYIVWIKGAHTLAVAHTLSLAPGVNTLLTSLLREGDASDDNVITVADFSILALAFGKSAVQVGYDAQADFNQDGQVSLNDFSLMAAHFGQLGVP